MPKDQNSFRARKPDPAEEARRAEEQSEERKGRRLRREYNWLLDRLLALDDKREFNKALVDFAEVVFNEYPLCGWEVSCAYDIRSRSLLAEALALSSEVETTKPLSVTAMRLAADLWCESLGMEAHIEWAIEEMLDALKLRRKELRQLMADEPE